VATFVLVPGAWHGAWCWERVVPLLEAAGHRVLAPELHGMGADSARAAQGSLAVWADQVAQLIREQDRPVILAGHSRGGAVISEVAERVPERIASLVYIAALLLPDGVAIREFLGETRDRAAAEIVKRDDGTCTVVSADVGPVFYTTTDPEWAERAASLLTPEPIASLAAPIHVTAERFGRVPRAYVECLQDLAVPLTAQRAMQATWPCDPVFTLDCDHSPFYAMPAELASALHRVATERGFTP
jgi:pimeloyl-ACP methyl ester carboxylesterase